MNFKLSIAKNYATAKADCLVLGYFSDQKRWAGGLPAATRKLLGQLVDSGDLNGKPGQCRWLYQVDGLAAGRLLLVGCGKQEDWDEAGAREFFTRCATQLLQAPVKSAAIAQPRKLAGRNPAWVAGQLATQFTCATYRYQRTLSKSAPKTSLQRVALLRDSGEGQAAVKKALQRGQAIGNGINAARELGNLPGNICTPSYLARQARKLAKGENKLTTQVLDEKQMESLGMGSLLSVSQGSEQPAKLITMQYRGGAKSEQPVVLVGKGITFDSGGISLKPGAKMDEMKFDMCGAASVFGAMQAIVEMALPLNVVGIVAASENLPSGRATKPGDVVTSMAGITIEVLNTDAEGRLVLCDALTYAEKFKPSAVIDIATLTGACVVALGSHNAGLLSNHQPLADQLLQAGRDSGDTAWQLPLDKAYQQQIRSNFADIANVGGPGAGTITAACFLARFTEKYHWAHLDIAGVAWAQGARKGATGRPVALLLEYLMQQAS